jgi:hypothetical protein
MRRFLSVAIFILMTPAWLVSQNVVAYKPGEKISYVINYGILKGGTVTLELFNDTLFSKGTWHSKMVAKTTGVADALYKILDIYESYIDPETQLPVKSIRNIREGRYRKYNEVLFDHKTRPDSAILTSDLTGVHITQHGIHDILSCFYFLRNNIMPGKTLVKGETITIMTWFTDELYPIRLRFMGIDEVRVGHGRLKCYKFNPVTEKGRLFKTEDAVSFWFSADNNFLPVKVRFDIFVGSFTVEMTGYEGLVYPLAIVRK